MRLGLRGKRSEQNAGYEAALDLLPALRPLMNRRAGLLSGGEQQRVAIARAIVHNPSVVLCDEPTGNLDSATSASVMELLKSINKKMGTTFLLVTHDSEVAKQCNRILHMDDGEIISDQRGDEEE